VDPSEKHEDAPVVEPYREEGAVDTPRPDPPTSPALLRGESPLSTNVANDPLGEQWAGSYNWTIAVIRKQNGTVTTLSQASQTLQFTWAPAGGGSGGHCPTYPNC
jgi:hypothetical protein